MIAARSFTTRLTLPLHRLAGRMRDYSLRTLYAADARRDRSPTSGDEVSAIAAAFAEMTQRIEAQTAREQHQASAHREMMASVAHDLRTPLTALHGHLEAMAGKTPAEPWRCARLLAAALAQSDKVRRLSQQLFELAALQSTDQVLHCERFRLDELVTDAVQKFDLVVGSGLEDGGLGVGEFGLGGHDDCRWLMGVVTRRHSPSPPRIASNSSSPASTRPRLPTWPQWMASGS